MVTSSLQGWDYIKSLIGKCPMCKETATLGNSAFSNKWRVCCMNSCCANHNSTREWENPFTAIHEWNEKYADKEMQDGT
jgi:hypothetical protein